MKNSIIVPVYNRSDLTSVCMKSIGDFLSPMDELIIVDNNSTDNTAMLVRIYARSHPLKNIVYLKNEKNYGFGKANNIGARAAKGENLLFISNDVVVNGDFIHATEGYLHDNPNTAVGARLITWQTGWNNIWNEVALIPYIEGWYMGVRKHIFDIILGYDENIFIDYEDVEISFRLHLAGIGLAQLALPIFHPYSGSSFSQLSESRLKYTMESLEHFGKKWGFTRK